MLSIVCSTMPPRVGFGLRPRGRPALSSPRSGWLDPEPPAQVGDARHLEPRLRAKRRLLVAARQPQPPHAEPREGVLDLVERAQRGEDALALPRLAAGPCRREHRRRRRHLDVEVETVMA